MREGPVRQIEDSALQEHVTGASLISLCRGVEGEAGKVEMPCLPSRGPNGPKALHDSEDGHATAVRSLGDFRPVPNHPKEGGRLDSFNAPVREIRLV